MRKIIIVFLCLIGAVVLAVFSRPQKRVVGGQRGFVSPNESVYREEYSCLGIQRDFCPNWPDYGCDLLCYGLVFNKKCYSEAYGDTGQLTKTPTLCRD